MLITHFGLTGPAILKLSSFAARLLNERKYSFTIQINWVNIQNTEIVMKKIQNTLKIQEKKLLSNVKPFDLPDRLWKYLLERSNLQENKKCGELGKKGLNKLTDVLTNDIYSVEGKNKFKEEFVTCGGVSLENIDQKTMQSKICKNLYFAGELMDIDGITGGYNLQAAWTTGFVAGQLL